MPARTALRVAGRGGERDRLAGESGIHGGLFERLAYPLAKDLDRVGAIRFLLRRLMLHAGKPFIRFRCAPLVLSSRHPAGRPPRAGIRAVLRDGCGPRGAPRSRAACPG